MYCSALDKGRVHPQYEKYLVLIVGVRPVPPLERPCVYSPVGCCGVEGVMDYTRWHKVVPETCFDQVTGNVWYLSGTGSVGCVRKFTSYLEGKAGWIAGLAFFLAFFQIFSFFAAFCLIKLKRDYQKSQEYLDR
ncbi:Tetraspanin-2A-like 3 [Homarus americanus]|uniref:Tetraspanin-2A-like 3 n=1 Tax=Homarus americanus TaxID=6706 RepID=A0A8J5MTB2_HOMAM|nr:Tetraspanin-2A-like 3 [Homarus americanus]